ncbi:MAG: hypothetical protein JO165_14145 [Candidatus Eremiobacteraeota bacterium]|nr:hypothetical protein [Candidatus Eremiobacteraeota bacterium]
MVNRVLRVAVLFFLWACAATYVANAQTQPSNTIAVATAASPPPIDGNLSDSAWCTAAKVTMTRNMRDRTAPAEPTTVYLLSDAQYLYVGFEAKQRGEIRATQHTNDVGQGTDDYVTVYLWPNDTQGFSYSFTANPLGTHYQYSSENTAYAPNWESAGRLVPGGYTVTMRIPFRAIRGSSGGRWRMQFERTVHLTFDDYVWAYDPATTSASSVLYAGYATGIGTSAHVASRPQPRFGIYGLGSIASKSIGGSTSRLGVDASIPVTASTSFVATVHPDYSNVEQDQQTIAPTAFPRFYNEVRPFFTQLSNFYNNFNCIGCPGVQELYTPQIPTPRYGYAFEGKESTFSFAGFDTVGFGRDDTAQAVNYQTPDKHYNFGVQHTTADGSFVCPYLANVSSMDCYGVPSVHDDTTLYGVSHDSLHGFSQYFNWGNEHGTFVTDASKATRVDAGVGVYDKDSFAGASIRKIGAQYLAVPVDGYLSQGDIAGFDVNANRTWYRSKTAFINRVIGYVNLDRYHDSQGRENLFDTQVAIGLTFPKKIHFRAQTGSDYVRLADGNYVPVNQNGVNLFLNYNTDVPTSISYFTGRFGPGTLDSWTRAVSVRLGARAIATFEADDNVQRLDRGLPSLTSWLDRASIALENGKRSSVALGVRRITGQNPLLETQFDSHGVLIAPGSQNAWNVSGAYYRRFPHDELYLVYGDASAFTTSPQLIFKWIHYVGAEKGT